MQVGKYDDDDDAVSTKSKYADETVDEAPAARRVIKRGWAAAEATKSADSPFAQRLQLSDDPVVVKFLEDSPYASFRQHWLKNKEGQKSFTCIKDIDPKGCPLCDAGDRPASRYSFNVIMLDAEEPLLRSYDVGVKAIDALKQFHQDPRQGPLPKHYWAISRSGTGKSTQTNHHLVKEGDLESDWADLKLRPLSQADIESFAKNAYGPDIVPVPTRKQLLEIAEQELGA